MNYKTFCVVIVWQCGTITHGQSGLTGENQKSMLDTGIAQTYFMSIFFLMSHIIVFLFENFLLSQDHDLDRK